MRQAVCYQYLAPEAALPRLQAKPSGFVVVVETRVSDKWRKRVADWMISKGCLYMMAWGIESWGWEAAVDRSNIQAFGGGDIPEEKFVMTSAHHNNSMEHVFWFSKEVVTHLDVRTTRTVILHIASSSRQNEMLRTYMIARPRFLKRHPSRRLSTKAARARMTRLCTCD